MAFARVDTTDPLSPWTFTATRPATAWRRAPSRVGPGTRLTLYIRAIRFEVTTPLSRLRERGNRFNVSPVSVLRRVVRA